jgi:O-antigen/teichoic acid export membrane protein
VKQVAVAITSPSRALRALKDILNDPLYRGALFLLANTVATSAIGFVFWTLAAHRYSASAIGVFSSVTSGAGLLATIAALGLPITMTRHIAGAEDPRELVIVAVTIITTVGTTLCLATVLVLGPHLPSAFHMQQRGGITLLVTVLVVFTALGSTLDAGLVATRSSRTVLIKNLVGSIVRLTAMLLLSSFRTSGLLISVSLGLVLATLLGGAALGRRIKGKKKGIRTFRMPWQYLSITSGNYIATVIGILPLSVVPIEVLAVRGAAETARFAVAFLIAGFLNFIPSTVGQVLFAEISRGEVPLGKQLRKALHAVYGLLLPPLAILLVAAPFILRLFGQTYATDATGCLRLLALSSLPAGGTYLVDSLLIARDRTAAYTFMQVSNAALVLGCVGSLVPRGLTAAAGGWALGQGASLVVGLIVLATGRVGRHHPRVSPVPAGEPPQSPQRDLQPRSVIYAFEPQIRELLATWPMMPTMLIAEQIGWDQSIQVLLDRVTELRSAYSHLYQHLGRTRYVAGETAQCGLWFPPIEVPVGFGQTRSAQQLPVLTMITSYSRWLSARLIPSRHAEDLFAGLWELLTTLGAVPQVLTWDSDSAIGRREAGRVELTNECADFCHALRAKVIMGRSADPETRGLIERAHAYLERSFLSGRTFASPMDFNAQLQDWLDRANTRQLRPPNCSPAELISIDRQAMVPLPLVAPPTGWHLSMKVGSHPFLRFESNAYSVHPAVIGRQVEFIADLNQIRVLCDGKVAAAHDRAWTRERTIRDPAHVSAAGMSSK